MNEIKNQKNEKSEFYRFQIFQGKHSASEKIEKAKTVGMAYLRKGQDMYTVRLWSFLNEKYFLLPSKKEAERYLVMTREPTKNPESKSKYYWNIVGNAKVNSQQACMEIEFDLFEKKLYMSLFPEAQATAKNLSPIEFASFEAEAA